MNHQVVCDANYSESVPRRTTGGHLWRLRHVALRVILGDVWEARSR